ncbi:ribokinase [Neoasaia chiangmaiensis NBRC 101099]|uniref:Ribokinase n=1 Tax=Neoasaia chiangmaiensis TaxID=320497 RepID=A0A1U9KQG5_9PROT|nr:ribokinase [Neoasaia chiangmaiensis]AQS88074.1 ribokinase [Neoasaia chiangmaiensis]GBR38742.1 ribokinase [Neoasaia chiangmaiensis NBRC 101099]GEN15752.1 ribokinase [Neoasaia chiangmaiensis]
MTESKPLILSFGSVNIDVTARARRLPRPGETVHAHGYTLGLGGKGSNQAAAAARLAASLGLHAALVGRVGRDAFGAQARADLERFGVDLQGLRDDAGNPTGLALIGIDDGGENSITVAGGANMAIDESDIVASAGLFDAARVLLLQLEIPQAAVLAAARHVRRRGAIVVMDPAPAPEEGLPEALWPLIDIITPNESETARLTDIEPQTADEAAAAARQLVARGAAGAVVKMGGRGVWWQHGDDGGFVPPFRVTPIDTVAAGDCFNAGLAVALAQGRDLAGATRVAAASGALATTKHGAADAAPTWPEVSAMLEGG